MVTAPLAIRFWATVEDCLVTFHAIPRNDAAAMVTSLWRRLPVAGTPFDDMIYHAEPWDIACNLVGNDLPVQEHQAEYHAARVRNKISSDVSAQLELVEAH